MLKLAYMSSSGPSPFEHLLHIDQLSSQQTEATHNYVQSLAQVINLIDTLALDGLNAQLMTEKQVVEADGVTVEGLAESTEQNHTLLLQCISDAIQQRKESLLAEHNVETARSALIKGNFSAEDLRPGQ